MPRYLLPLTLLALACTSTDSQGDKSDELTEHTGPTSDSAQPAEIPTDPIDFTVVATYERPGITPWDGLDYDNITAHPIRRAEAWVLASGSNDELARGETDDEGTFSFTGPPGVDVIVYIAASVLLGGWRVVDNTRDDALDTLSKRFDAPTSTVAELPLLAGVAHDGNRYTNRTSAPYAILDTVLTLCERVDPLVAAPFVALDLHWSIRNTPGRGPDDQGLIGTSFHRWGSGIFLLGEEDVDTDEYDITVIAHEWFHYFENAFSRSDSKGGSHGSSAILQLSTAWGEGSATGLGNLILGERGYVDTDDPRQADGFENDLEENRAGNAVGFYGTRSVSSLLWDLTDAQTDESDTTQISQQLLFDVLINGHAQTEALVSIFSLGFELSKADPSLTQPIARLYEREAIVAPIDPWGTGETNDGGDPGAVNPAIYRPIALGESLVLEALGPASEDENRTSDYRYYRFTAPAALTVEVALAADEDVDLRVYDRGDLACDSRRASGNEDCTFPAAAGANYVIEVDGTYLDDAPIDVAVSVSEAP